jgi:tetratricopeptide (TPR) repeat protein
MAKDLPNSPDVSPPKTAALRTGGVAGSLRGALGGLLADPFRLLLVLAVNVAVVAGIVSTAMILRNRKLPAKPVTLAMALGALDRGNTAAARSMAQRLAADKDITTEDWGGPDFILGTLAAKAAEEAGGKERAESFRVAALYLARSRERGFPAHRESAGLYLLGKSLCRCGRLEEALPVLEQALRGHCDQTTEIRMLLIEARAGVQPPELDKALAESQKLLSDLQLTDPQRRQVLVQQAQILLRLNRTQECAKALDKIPDNPLLRCDISLLRGRLALGEGQALKKAATGPSPPAPLPQAGEGSYEEKFRIAIEAFRKALSQDLGDSRAARQAT